MIFLFCCYNTVHGGWSSWSGWTACTQSCGAGSQERSRTCTNPSPRHGGNSCLGNPGEKQPCNEQSCPGKKRIFSPQEIIKVREWMPHIGPLTKVNLLKLFLDIVPSSSADITSALRGLSFHEGSVYMYVVSFRFVSKQRKTSNAVEMSSLIFWLQAIELRLSVCLNTFRNKQ